MGVDPKQAPGPPALSELQRAFQDGLVRGGRGIAELVAGPDAGWVDTRLGVYQTAYYARLTEALQGDFRALKSCMGDEPFVAMVRAYVQAHPSVHPSIRWFGSRLADFLSHTEPYRSEPLLAEIAAFEWALGLAFDAPDAPIVTLEQMTGLSIASWPASRIEFHPSLQRLELYFNVPAIWRASVFEPDRGRATSDTAIRAQRKGPAGDMSSPRNEGATVEPERSADARQWAVWRRGMTPYYRSIEGEEQAAFDGLRNGATFEQACEALCRSLDEQDVPLRFASLLKGWITEELVTRIVPG